MGNAENNFHIELYTTTRAGVYMYACVCLCVNTFLCVYCLVGSDRYLCVTDYNNNPLWKARGFSCQLHWRTRSSMGGRIWRNSAWHLSARHSPTLRRPQSHGCKEDDIASSQFKVIWLFKHLILAWFSLHYGHTAAGVENKMKNHTQGDAIKVRLNFIC